MDDEERRDETEEMNEDIVEDEDSDTQDIEENEDKGDSEILRRLNALEESITRLAGGIDALREAQSVMVENGATIIDDSEDDFDLGIDDYVSPQELDLII